MKKTLILTLTLCLAGILAACGRASGQPANTPLTDTLSESATGNPQTEQLIVASDLKPSEGLEFESNGDDTCTLVGIGICKDADLVIPTESPDGETLTVIEEDAFMGLEDVSSVTLLNGNYEVEDRAFQYGEMTPSLPIQLMRRQDSLTEAQFLSAQSPSAGSPAGGLCRLLFSNHLNDRHLPDVPCRTTDGEPCSQQHDQQNPAQSRPRRIPCAAPSRRDPILEGNQLSGIPAARPTAMPLQT